MYGYMIVIYDSDMYVWLHSELHSELHSDMYVCMIELVSE